MDSVDHGRSARKRRAIMEAATALFLDKGYDGTSVDEIAAVAEVSKRTVYQHFADKEGLFTEIIMATTAQVDEVVRLVAGTLDATLDLDADLRKLARAFLAALTEPGLLQLRRLVIADASRFPDLGRAWYEQGFERVLATLATSFRVLAEKGSLQLDDPLLAANHFVGMLLWIPVNRAMFTGIHGIKKAELQRYADAAARAFLAAYRPR
ncbi:MAG TPA: TetR/AcrR family transcriptional regulator [Chloroflexota bacterium]|nr:TetR/AcrR family transcriptional regulator [Chloroflexota bacterium]